MRTRPGRCGVKPDRNETHAIQPGSSRKTVTRVEGHDVQDTGPQHLTGYVKLKCEANHVPSALF
jgi:translation initiation factor 1 (eIF-1/SUI1)